MLLANTSLVFTLAILIALVLPDFADVSEPLIIPLLIVAMTLSMKDVVLTRKDLARNARPAVSCALLNYLLLGMVVLVPAFLFVENQYYLYGLIIMAAIPPAVAVVPFTYLLGGDIKLSTIGEVLSYLISLAYTPALVLLLAGSMVDVWVLVRMLLLLILVPFLASRIIKGRQYGWSKPVVNTCFAVITYAVIALNHATLTSNPKSLIIVTLILFSRTFLTGFIVYAIARRRKIPKPKCISYSLFSAYKNNGAVAAIALILFGREAALPTAIAGIFELTYVIIFKKIVERY